MLRVLVLELDVGHFGGGGSSVLCEVIRAIRTLGVC